MKQAEAFVHRARQVVDEELGGASVEVSEELLEGRIRTLVDLSQDARMLVLGSHSGQFLHHRLGSVVGACLHMASCPVVVIPMDVPATVPLAEVAPPA
jgi:nucleotide-binding universal stress UspA family protein